MKKISKILFLVLFAALVGSCDEPQGAAFVYGTVTVTPGGTNTFQGSLAASGGADVYGYCKVSNDTLEFTVGHTSEAGLDNVVGVDSPTVISIAGVAGPPTEGVFDLTNTSVEFPETKSGDNLATTFVRGRAKNDVDSWNFEFDADKCTVQLFAVPVKGELIFEEKLNKSFDYYVNLNCSGLGIGGNDGESLSSFKASLYFENCS